MTTGDTSEVQVETRTMSSGPTDAQLRVATALGVEVAQDSGIVAAARIRDAVAEVIGERHGPRPATLRQIEFGRSLDLDVRYDSVRVASARIEEELQKRNFQALAGLALKPGDRVLKREVFEHDGKRHESVREFVVSSIQSNCRVFFKGGNGLGAWPTELERLTDHRSSKPRGRSAKTPLGKTGNRDADDK